MKSIYVFFVVLSFIGTIQAFEGNINVSKYLTLDETIQKETEEILEAESTEGSYEEKSLELYNQRGISFFLKNDYQSALNDFNHILEVKFSKNQTRDLVVGAALWGRAICHACMDKDEAFEDFERLEGYFSEVFHYEFSCKDGAKKLKANTSNDKTRVVEFANPNERISIEECKERVRGSARSLKLFIGPLIRDIAKRAVFAAFIDALEDQGLYCCRKGTFWTTCVSPLLEKLQAWKAFGIPADPAWD